MLDLSAKVAVVTGAAHGIGRAISLRLVEQGAHVIMSDIDDAAASEVVPAGGGNLDYVHCDVADPRSCAELMKAVESRGQLDILVNNAGICLENSIESATLEEWERTIAVNLRSVFVCSQLAIPLLKRRGGGVIVNIASMNGFYAEEDLAAYCASKGGVIALTKSMAIDLGKYGIRCAAVCPGVIDTGLTRRWYERSPDPAAARRAAEQAQPLGRLGTPEDVASVVAWIASDEAGFFSGQCFVIDGALTSGRTGMLAG